MAQSFWARSAALAAEVKAYPGVERLLGTLRGRGWLIGIVTGKAKARTVDVLARTGLASLIDALSTPDDGVGKPDPAALWGCLNKLGLGRRAAVFIGDTAIDMEAARRAGVDGVFRSMGCPPRVSPVELSLPHQQPTRAA
jgi:HAD superfamily hydrolase (TIGR01509 family)